VSIVRRWSGRASNEFAVLVKDLDSVGLTVADEQPALGIEGRGVDHMEFTWAHPFFPHVLRNFPSFSPWASTKAGLIAAHGQCARRRQMDMEN
jgi:hypothetical protein